MSDSEELKPCPFCGGEAKVLGTKYEGGDYYIVCEKCRVRVGSYSNPVEAIEAWNKRANSEKPNNSICRQREQEIRIGLIFRLARYIQRNVRLCIDCDLRKHTGRIAPRLIVGDKYFVKMAIIDRLMQQMLKGREIPGLTFSGRDFLKAFIGKNKKRTGND